MAINFEGIGPKLAINNSIEQQAIDLKKKALILHKGNDKAQALKASKDFESVYVGEFLKSIFPKNGGDNLFGGGAGENAFQSYLLDEYAKSVVNQGGFGIAKQVYTQLLKQQEVQK